MGSSVQKSCRAERSTPGWPGAAALHAASAASKIPLESPKGWRAPRPISHFQESIPPPASSPPPFACVDFGEARVSSTPARSSWESWESGVALAAGVRRPLKPLPDVLGRLARMARLPLASSSSSLRANHFENKAALAEKIQNRRKANTWRWLSTTCGV